MWLGVSLTPQIGIHRWHSRRFVACPLLWSIIRILTLVHLESHSRSVVEDGRLFHDVHELLLIDLTILVTVELIDHCLHFLRPKLLPQLLAHSSHVLMQQVKQCCSNVVS